MRQERKFQTAAIDLIVDRLSSRTGTGRFLLADEVGLGKTVVASGVIERLSGRRRKGGLVVAYVCSNREIAAQNLDKLGSGVLLESDRLTLAALETRRIARARTRNEKVFVSLTPGTSLDVRSGTGRAYERLLLLYILGAQIGYPVTRRHWVRFFQCSAGEQWPVGMKSKLAAFRPLVSKDLLRRVARLWKADGVLDELEAAVRAGEPFERRGSIIGRLRFSLAVAVTEVLAPDLVVLDEFQNFASVLSRAQNDESSLDSRLLSRAKALLLSATPYTIYASDAEEGNHREELMAVLAFLSKTSVAGLGKLAQKLEQVTSEVASLRFVEEDHGELLAKKRDLERSLKTVMCRTERNWYLKDLGKGTEELLLPESVAHPTPAELRDFLTHHDALSDTTSSGASLVDYWKSSPRFLGFMDASYVAVAEAKKKRQLPSTLSAPERPSQAIDDNLRLRALARRFAGEHARPHEHLWIPPSYQYYRTAQHPAVDGDGPAKYLVFSHWRFVPKMIAATLSDVVERRLGKLPATSPLSVGKDRGLSIADVCLPSTLLARLVDPLAVCRELGSNASAERFNRRAMSRIEEALKKDYGVVLSSTAPVSPWPLLARLDADRDGELVDALRAAQRSSGAKLDTRRLIERFDRWAKEDKPLMISRRALRHLTEISLFSPAICITRALRDTFGELGAGRWHAVARLTLGSLRHYLNRPVVQAIIRRHGGSGAYARRVLRFSERRHLAEVVAEYVPLLRGALRDGTLEAVVTCLDGVFGLGQGTPKANVVRRGRLFVGERSLRSHVALAFGDETRSAEEGEGTKQRRTRMREAFNSPFWPFVLATTSVGQEGLDFHLYCRDVVHWNLPTNPVDFEQREGRVNRYGALWIRRAVAREHTIDTLLKARLDLTSPWPFAFEHAERNDRRQQYKHGLFPYWIYEPRTGAIEGVRRHVLFHSASEDAQGYRRLLEAVSHYRLAFGQPNQRDLLCKLEERLAGLDDARRTEALRRLPAYMVNLSPFRADHALVEARASARVLADDPETLTQLLDDVLTVRLPSLADQERLAQLLEHLRGAIRERTRPRLDVIAALEYLRNPYDELHDDYGPHGLEDDALLIRRAAQRLSASAVRS